MLALRLPDHPYARRFLAAGVLGAFTTMSTFQVETALLLRDGHPALAAVYVAASVAGGLVLAAAGLAVGRRAVGPGTGSAVTAATWPLFLVAAAGGAVARVVLDQWIHGGWARRSGGARSSST